MSDAPDLEIHEAAPLSIIEAPGGDGPFNADGSVTMALIRPCNGRGPYRNIYEADVLSRDAASFKGLPMFDNHDSPAAKKARNFLPRAPSALAGAVRESWWDPSFSTPDDGKFGFDQGAVMGKCALTDAMEALVRKVPEVVKGSLNTQATNKRMGERNGQKGWVVEGFVNDPETSSFDLVTAAGAGGRVVSVLEGLYADPNETDGHASGGSMSDEMTLAEALQSDEVSNFLDAKVDARVQEALAPGGTHSVEAIQQQVRDEFAARELVRTLAREATGIIENAKGLTASAKTRLLTEYGLEGDKPGRALAVIEAVTGDDGKVTKSASDVLRERLDEDVKEFRTMISEAKPTIPRAPITSGDANGDGSDVEEAPAWQQRIAAKGMKLEHFGVQAPANNTTGE